MPKSRTAEKAFDKSQHQFMIKKENSSESGHKGNTPQHNTGISDKPKAKILRVKTWKHVI